MCGSQRMTVWKSVLPFHSGAPRNQTRVSRPGSKHLYPWDHLDGSHFLLLASFLFRKISTDTFMPSSMCVSNGLTSLHPGVQAELYLWAFYNSTCIKSTCPFLMLAYVTGPLLSFLGTYPFLVEHIQQ